MPKVKVGRHEHHNDGWCMVLTPEGRIVSAVEQKSHEGNGLAATVLTRAVQKHPNVNINRARQVLCVPRLGPRANRLPEREVLER